MPHYKIRTTASCYTIVDAPNAEAADEAARRVVEDECYWHVEVDEPDESPEEVDKDDFPDLFANENGEIISSEEA